MRGFQKQFFFIFEMILIYAVINFYHRRSDTILKCEMDL